MPSVTSLVAVCCGLLLASCATVQPKPTDTSTFPSHQNQTDGTIPASRSPAANTKSTDELTSELLYDLLVANLGYQFEQTDTATDALVRAARRTNNPELLAQATRTTLHYNQPILAAELGERWITVSPEEDAAYIVTALAYLQQTEQSNHLNLASHVLTRFIEKDTESPAAAYQKLRSVLTRHPLEKEVLSVSRKLATLHPDEIEAWLLHAALAENLSDQTALEEALNQLLKLDPQLETAAQYRLAALERDAAKHTDDDRKKSSLAAIHEFANHYLQQSPAATQFRQQYAQLLLRQQNQDAAITQYQGILKHQPEHPDALYALGLLYYERDDFHHAQRALSTRLEQTPDDDRSRIYLGLSLHELKQYDDAIAVLERVRNEEMRFSAQRQIIVSIEKKAGVDAALAYLDGLHASNPEESIQLINDQVNLLRRADRKQQAREVIDEAVARHPDNDSLRYNRALFLVEFKDLTQHEADMRVLLDKEPENANYLNTLGYTLLELSNRIDEARALIEKAFKLKPDDPYITDSLGWAEFKSGNYAKAEKWLKAAYALDPDAEIAAHLGEVYWVQGRKDEARKIWAKGKAQNPDNPALKETLNRLKP